MKSLFNYSSVRKKRILLIASTLGMYGISTVDMYGASETDRRSRILDEARAVDLTKVTKAKSEDYDLLPVDEEIERVVKIFADSGKVEKGTLEYTLLKQIMQLMKDVETVCGVEDGLTGTDGRSATMLGAQTLESDGDESLSEAEATLLKDRSSRETVSDLVGELASISEDEETGPVERSPSVGITSAAMTDDDSVHSAHAFVPSKDKNVTSDKLWKKIGGLFHMKKFLDDVEMERSDDRVSDKARIKTTAKASKIKDLMRSFLKIDFDIKSFMSKEKRKGGSIEINISTLNKIYRRIGLISNLQQRIIAQKYSSNTFVAHLLSRYGALLIIIGVILGMGIVEAISYGLDRGYEEEDYEEEEGEKEAPLA